jgi:hypothetical protein
VLYRNTSAKQKRIVKEKKMKKYWSYLLIAIILMLILSGCGRDLSTPSNRLVGHWVAGGAIKTEYYYSEIDSKTKIGTLTEYDPRSGSVITCNYSIFTEAPDGESVNLEEACPGDIAAIVDYVVKTDGTSALRMSTKIDYVDSKTKP